MVSSLLEEIQIVRDGICDTTIDPRSLSRGFDPSYR